MTGCGVRDRTAADSIPEGWPGKGSRASDSHVKDIQKEAWGQGERCVKDPAIYILLGTEQLGGI